VKRDGLGGRKESHAPVLAPVAILLIIFLYVPVTIVVVFAFQGSPRLGLPIEGPSLRWFQAIFADGAFRRSLTASLQVAAGAATFAIVITTLAALALTRFRLRFGRLLSVGAIAPIAIPGLIVGIALLTFFATLGIRPSLVTVLIAHTLYVIPYSFMTVTSSLAQLEPAIDEAARDLGANPWQAFWRTTFPLVWPAIAGAGVLAFALSFDEFLITLFVIGHDSTLPVFVWSRMRRTIDPSVNAVATTLLAVVLIGATISLLLAAAARRRVHAGGQPGSVDVSGAPRVDGSGFRSEAEADRVREESVR
jgi:spermidine/putrescine transport system permease protein